MCKKKEKISVSRFRYKYEMPMIIIGFIAIFLYIIMATILLFLSIDIPEWVYGAFLGLLIPFLAIFTIRFLYWNSISNGVEINENQLSEIYDIYLQLATEMGFDSKKLKLPRLYLINGNGVMNAFAAKCTLKKRYIVIHSDLLDLAYKFDEMPLIKFVLAHELGHHKCGHTNIWRLIFSPFLKPLYLDKSLTRAQEYTADRVALYYAPEGALSMIYLFSGKYMGSRIEIEEYFKSIDLHDETIWLKLSNFLSDHPVGFRRMKALKEAKEKGTWDVHGKFI
ncbi:M48 family metallopeptidase [Staphylococcus delphini]|uniref:M48 family metallopeptidase n=1 Tax=Staphylococcus delphini TaxID=53344 RepID=UPI0023B23A82|nr:M48 family metallopeptidase [Staphylococcus delphini]MDE9753612.1 M48 family metallopeptidase [Staphylococcus delphini]MDE9790866.1 M48 family metallopeptidase [Staphylococcus delphini]MDE9793155.1 M48 family metallopeptidase [Staphylococcus delphini]MDE9795429.1 M48 family metallopeptidase [Staphylococcus delphini]MDE9797730.1 M48 family metallopeptidase [Staphylococcus delphini]